MNTYFNKAITLKKKWQEIIFLRGISSPLKTPLSAFVQGEIAVYTESVMAVIDGDILALTLKNNLLPHMGGKMIASWLTSP